MASASSGVAAFVERRSAAVPSSSSYLHPIRSRMGTAGAARVAAPRHQLPARSGSARRAAAAATPCAARASTAAGSVHPAPFVPPRRPAALAAAVLPAMRDRPHVQSPPPRWAACALGSAPRLCAPTSPLLPWPAGLPQLPAPRATAAPPVPTPIPRSALPLSSSSPPSPSSPVPCSSPSATSPSSPTQVAKPVLPSSPSPLEDHSWTCVVSGRKRTITIGAATAVSTPVPLPPEAQPSSPLASLISPNTFASLATSEPAPPAACGSAPSPAPTPVDGPSSCSSSAAPTAAACVSPVARSRSSPSLAVRPSSSSSPSLKAAAAASSVPPPVCSQKSVDEPAAPPQRTANGHADDHGGPPEGLSSPETPNASPPTSSLSPPAPPAVGSSLSSSAFRSISSSSLPLVAAAAASPVQHPLCSTSSVDEPAAPQQRTANGCIEASRNLVTDQQPTVLVGLREELPLLPDVCLPSSPVTPAATSSSSASPLLSSPLLGTAASIPAAPVSAAVPPMSAARSLSPVCSTQSTMEPPPTGRLLATPTASAAPLCAADPTTTASRPPVTVTAAMRVCAACTTTLPKTDFSSAQLKKLSRAVCKACALSRLTDQRPVGASPSSSHSVSLPSSSLASRATDGYCCCNPHCQSSLRIYSARMADEFFRTCSSCRAVRYCDRRCEEMDREAHAAECAHYATSGTAASANRQ